MVRAIAALVVILACPLSLADIQITTWNIEHLNSSDRVILGDFNDNPFALTSAGNPSHIQTLYQHMARKRYVDMVPASMEFTRMNDNLTSLIDHIIANSFARNDIVESEADKFTPGASSTFATWRGTFSDHFPLSFTLESKTDFDVDFTS